MNDCQKRKTRKTLLRIRAMTYFFYLLIEIMPSKVRTHFAFALNNIFILNLYLCHYNEHGTDCWLIMQKVKLDCDNAWSPALLLFHIQIWKAVLFIQNKQQYISLGNHYLSTYLSTSDEYGLETDADIKFYLYNE